MHQLVTIRKQMNITQEQMALYLGITRDLLAQAEIGRRQLPTFACARFVLIEKAFVTIMRAHQGEWPPGPMAEEVVNERLYVIEARMRKITRLLNGLYRNYSHALVVAALCEKRSQDVVGAEEIELLMNTISSLNNTGELLATIKTLELEMGVLQEEKGRLRKMMQ